MGDLKAPRGRRIATRAWLRDRPWIWVLLAFAVFVAVNIAFVIVAHRNPPIPA